MACPRLGQRRQTHLKYPCSGLRPPRLIPGLEEDFLYHNAQRNVSKREVHGCSPLRERPLRMRVLDIDSVPVHASTVQVRPQPLVQKVLCIERFAEIHRAKPKEQMPKRDNMFGILAPESVLISPQLWQTRPT